MIAKDSPNFIGNHVGLYGVVQVLKLVESGAYTIEEIDAITGPAIGRPKSATFRTFDLVGIDVLAHVIRNLHERLPDEEARREFVLPPFVDTMVERKMVGEKSGQGFYKRVKTPDGGSDILTLDPATLEYRPRKSPRLPSLEAAAAITDVRERVRTLYCGQGQGRRVPPRDAHADARLHRQGHAGHRLLARRRRSRDAVGLRMGAGTVRADGCGRHRQSGPTGPEGRVRSAAGRHPTCRSSDRPSGATASSRRTRARASWIWATACLCVEFHSKMNAIGGDTIQMLHAGLQARRPRTSRRWSSATRANIFPPAPTSCCSCSKRRRRTGTKST